MRKKAPPPGARQAWRALRPWRNPALKWFEEDGRVVLHIQRRVNWKTRLLAMFMPIPAERKIVLDQIGTHVWKLLDGKRTAGTIAREVGKEYKLGDREAELSVQQFFKELARRGYVGFTGDETPTGDDTP